MWTDEDAAVAAAYRVDVDLWRSGFDEVLDRIAPRFGRCEPLRNAGALMLGLVSDIGRNVEGYARCSGQNIGRGSGGRRRDRRHEFVRAITRYRWTLSTSVTRL